MIQVREEDIDKITEAFALLLQGKRPNAIELPEDHPDDELQQAVGYINTFFETHNETADFAYQLSRGEIGNDPPRGRTLVLQSLKNLHASLRALTWTTQQIAQGDLSQQVNFMGEFSEAFNSMTHQLQQSFEERARVTQQLQQQLGEMARMRRAMLNIMEDMKEAGNHPSGRSIPPLPQRDLPCPLYPQTGHQNEEIGPC